MSFQLEMIKMMNLPMDTLSTLLNWRMHGLNPAIDDAFLDKDADGLTNLYEYQIGTKLDNADTDGNGYSDDWEINNGYNPLDASSKPGGFGWV
ncbi:MAG: thrombospondin type 3 repeat-containing protein [Candidatus Heimdallarchaeota archaeon]|nr:thrombospondin type 3 repeat-containing protein [Candidatus Heimdallarchaeota archaeon]